MRAVKDGLPAPYGEGEKPEGPRPGYWHVSVCQWVGGRVRKLRAMGDQSAPIPEELTSELGGII